MKNFRPMTEKQFAFITKLDGKQFYSGEHSKMFPIIQEKKDLISVQLASRIIDYLKHEVEIFQESNRRVFIGYGNGSTFYASNCDLYEEEMDDLINQLNLL